MNDYEFGEYLYCLRLEHGLRQKQLGAELGVSNKAVSKWETGAAKPQMDTLYKLARFYSISLDDLLSKRMPKIGAEEGGKKMKKDCLELAHDRMIQLYGKKPPLQIQERYEEEQRWFTDELFYAELLYLKKLWEATDSHHGSMFVRGDIGDSFLAWLAGATRTNPLPPHYYCPACKKVEYVTEVYDGWDLPAKSCDCGHVFKRDGHRLPYSMMNHRTPKEIAVNIPSPMLSIAADLLKEHFKGLGRIYRIEITEDKVKGCVSNRYILITDEEPFRESIDGETVRITFQDYFMKCRDNLQILFIETLTQNLIQKTCEEADMVPPRIDILEDGLLESLSSDDMMKTYYKEFSYLKDQYAWEELKEKYPCHDFSDLLRLDGLGKKAVSEKVNIEDIIQAQNKGELVAFREDIYDHILDKCKNNGLNGIGLATKIATMARKGLYAEGRIEQEARDLIEAIGVSRAYINDIQNTCYLFPKAHCVGVIHELLLLKVLSMKTGCSLKGLWN